MARVDTSQSANIHFRSGSSGSGKSWSIKIDIKKAGRLIIFDPDDEYAEIPRIHTVKTARDLLAMLKTHPRGALRLRFVANGKEAFDFWCRAVFGWGNCTCVAEEIAGVTSPSKAPAGWHMLISRGRKRGITIYAVTQRPAEADKTVLGNATTIRTGRLSRANDRKYMAIEMDIPVIKINVLQNLEFVEKSHMTGKAFTGKVGTKQRREIITHVETNKTR